jgi:hypothetical protein
MFKNAIGEAAGSCHSAVIGSYISVLTQNYTWWVLFDKFNLITGILIIRNFDNYDKADEII